MPSTAARGGTAGARAAITLALSALLAVAFGLSSLAPTAGAPPPAAPQEPAEAEDHSSCPAGSESLWVPEPDEGWSDDDTEFSNGEFSVWTYLNAYDTTEPNSPNELWFWNAWPPVVAVRHRHTLPI